MPRTIILYQSLSILSYMYTEIILIFQGDSGGPLVTKNFELTSFKEVYNVIAITSFGKACGISGDPGIYTRVQPYLEWLESNIWPDA